MNYIDFHIHIDFYDKPEDIIEKYENHRIYCLFVTNLPELFEKHYKSTAKYKYVRLALGYHPEMISQYEFNKDLFIKYINYTNYIGEIGIDKSIKQKRYIQKQIEIFDFITQKKFSNGKIISIHSRGFELEILDILKKNQAKLAVFHWYSGKIHNIKKIVDEGYYFSINPNMTRSNKGIQIIKSIPRDKILFETDGPFTRIDKKIITPELIPHAYKRISQTCGFDIKDIVFSNFKKLLIQAQLQRL